MPGLNIGYARVSTDRQDLTAQRDGLQALGVLAERFYVDHGLAGTDRERPGLHQARAACRAGDTLVVTKLDRLARSHERCDTPSGDAGRRDDRPRVERDRQQLPGAAALAGERVELV